MNSPTFSAEQVYLTHCHYGDSFRSSGGGFGIRASSSDDDALLEFAEAFPEYELPPALLATDPVPENAPWRLARVSFSSGQEVLVHSAYVRRDTRGRPGNHLTHFLFGPPLGAGAVRSWAAPFWCSAYPAGAPTRLARAVEAPVGRAVSDFAVTAFLTGRKVSPPPAGLCDLTSPGRLNADARRVLLARFLCGVSLACETHDRNRARLYVHAEPGLVAMLVYAAARLLPAWMTGRLTFSTYESFSRLSQFDRALVIGTYTGSTDRGLEPEHLVERGFGLDTFHSGVHSREMEAGLGHFAALAGLAAAAEWGLIDQLHAYWKGRRAGAADFAASIDLARAHLDLEEGKSSLAQLQVLEKDPASSPALARHDQQTWPTILEACFREPMLAGLFAKRFTRPERREEVFKLAIAKLRSGDIAGWDGAWQLLTAAAPNELLRYREKATVASAKEEFDGNPRNKIRQLWLLDPAAAFKGDLSDQMTRALDKLFRPSSTKELDDILRASAVPVRFRAIALGKALLDEELHTAALGLLITVDIAVFQKVLRGVVEGKRPDNLQQWVRDPVMGKGLLARFLDVDLFRGCDRPHPFLTAAGWVELLMGLETFDESWQVFWLTKEKLRQLLTGLGGDSSAVGVWRIWVGRIDLRRYSDPTQFQIWYDLYDAAGRLEMEPGYDENIAPIAVKHLAEFAVKRAMELPSDQEVNIRPSDLWRAARLLGPDPLAALSERFARRFGGADPASVRTAEQLEEYALIFARFYALEDTANWAYAMKDWGTVTAVAREKAPAYQRYFLENCVPSEFRCKVLLSDVCLDSIDPALRKELQEKYPAEEAESPVGEDHEQNPIAETFEYDPENPFKF